MTPHDRDLLDHDETRTLLRQQSCRQLVRELAAKLEVARLELADATDEHERARVRAEAGAGREERVQ